MTNGVYNISIYIIFFTEAVVSLPLAIAVWLPLVFIGSNSVETDSQTEWTDVQKKIIPWKNSTPSLDPEMVFQDRAAKLGKSNSRLIVVASLIDKPTNLGGKVDCTFLNFYFRPLG